MKSTELGEMLSAIDMEDWLAFEGIEYRKTRGTSGEQLNIKCCPACGKEDWKVYSNAETGLGNCFSGSCTFGNGKGTFNKFSFMREHQLNLNDSVKMMDYVKSVAREMGWRPKRLSTVAVEMENPNLRLPDYEEIPIRGKNLKYLANRRVDIEMAQYFNLGYIAEGYFNKRIFIPIHDLNGELVSFQARDITGKDAKKYLFPSGFASTGKILYNGHNALGIASAVMVEGVFDVIGVKVSFQDDLELRNLAVVGSFGMNLSGDVGGGDNDQLSRFITLKRRGLRVVTIMWDGEAAAIKKAVSAGERLQRIGLKVRIAILPKDRDPSDIDSESLKRCYRAARWLTPKLALTIKLSGDKMRL